MEDFGPQNRAGSATTRFPYAWTTGFTVPTEVRVASQPENGQGLPWVAGMLPQGKIASDLPRPNRPRLRKSQPCEEMCAP